MNMMSDEELRKLIEERDQLKYAATAAVAQLDALTFENARIRSALDEANDALVAVTKDQNTRIELTYQVLIIPGDVEIALERAVIAMGGVDVAKIPKPGTEEDEELKVLSTEFRSANELGNRTLQLARALFPTGQIETRRVRSG